MASPSDDSARLLPAAIQAAGERIGEHVRRTPTLPSHALSTRLGGPVVLKCENLQLTGSFKLRGALNKLLSLPHESLDRGVVTASTGNHGAAVAYAAQIAGTQAHVVVPADAAPAKLAAIERLGARIDVRGNDSVHAELAAREMAEERGAIYVSPYNDLDVVAGQGTVGAELLDDVADLEAVVVAVGGGGLAAGVAGIVKDRSPATRVIGCSPAASAVMYHSLQAGRILDMPSEPTLSDGTAGGVEPDAITFEILDRLLDDFVLVEEHEIRSAFIDLIEREHLLVEGSAAMAYAAASRLARRSPGTTAVIMCGANVGVDQVRAIIG